MFIVGVSNSNQTSQAASFNNFVPLLSKTTDAGNSDGHTVEYDHNLNYYHSFLKKGESVSVTSTISVNPSHTANVSDDRLLSFTPGLTSDTLARIANSHNTNFSTNLSADYNYPLSKTLTAGINIASQYSNSGSDLFTYQLDPRTGVYDLFLPSQSSDLTRGAWQQDIHPQLIYRKNSININIGFVAESQQIDNRFNQAITDLNQHFNYFFSNISLGLGKINFGYTETVSQPSINDLLPTTIVYDQLNSFEGNPDLHPTRLRNFTVLYNQFNPQGIFIFLSARVTMESNSITQKVL